MIFSNIIDKKTEEDKVVYKEGMDPNVDLRSDLWPTMTVTQLAKQHDICITKLGKLTELMGPVANPSLIQMYRVLQIALADLSALVDNRSANK